MHLHHDGTEQKPALMCSQITALAFSPDGQTLASGSEDGALMTWDLKDARRTALTPEHTGPVWSLAYSQGAGSLLASGICSFHVLSSCY